MSALRKYPDIRLHVQEGFVKQKLMKMEWYHIPDIADNWIFE